jgi:transmembrane sensor
MNTEEIPYTLISKHLSGETSQEEDEQLWSWLELKEENLKYFQELVLTYNHPEDMHFDLPNEKRLFDPPIEIRADQHGFKLWMKVAASILLVGLIGASVIMFRKTSATVYETQSGEVKQFFLPDSTEVWLNGNSTLSFAEGQFLKERRVKLRGEGFFVIAENHSFTFEIFYDSIVAQVHSGSIDIESYASRREKRAVVSEGVVTFIDFHKDGFNITATSGESMTSLADYGILSVENNSDLNYDSWKTGVYAFDDVTLNLLTDVLLKGSDTTVVIDDHDIKYQSYSGIFESTRPRAALQQVLTSMDAAIQNRDGAYYLNRKTKL